MAHKLPPDGESSSAEFDPRDHEGLDLDRGEAGRAVEQLLEEVETQTEPEPLFRVRGLRGKAAIVTGGSTGIGRAVALALARSGVDIAFSYLPDGEGESSLAAEQTADELERCGVRVLQRAVDCSDPGAVADFVSEAVGRLKGMHILVNNAGISRAGSLVELSDEEWDIVLRTNLWGTFFFLRAVAPVFQRQEYGKVVNVASVHGIRSEHGLSNLSASKAGVLALTRSAAIELGPYNVNVNAVAPGYVRTSRLTRDVSAETLDRVREQSALGRLGDPQDVADAVIFLCSEAARHITGAVLPVDGGYLL